MRHGRLRRVLTVLGLLGASTLASVLLLEAGVIAIFGEQPKFPRHVVGANFGLRINEPYARYRHKSADVTVFFRVNGQGMRADRDFPYEKPDSVRRIVSLGDSFTMGYEVELEDTFSGVLERELREHGFEVEVLNAGVSGYSNAEECLYLERELLRFDPDLVLISFFGNDLVDNVRSNLFRLDGDELVEVMRGYVPAGGLGNFLNTNWFFNLLSERSNAFVLLKERGTLLVKKRIVGENVRNLDRLEAGDASADPAVSYRRALAGAIFERIYRTTHRAGLPLVIQSIPSYRKSPARLLELFPLEEFNVNREGVWFLSGKEVLEPWLGKELLHHERSHGHWTPHSHEAAGRALASLILREGLLD